MIDNAVTVTLQHLRRRILPLFFAAALLGAATAQTVTIATHYNDQQIAPVAQCAAQYQADHPGVNIVFQQITYGDYLQTILTSRIAGQSPDVYHLYQVWAPAMVANDVLDAPPADLVEWLKASYLPSTLEAATMNGQIWGIPTEVSNYMLLYNKKLLAEAGYSAPPTTWAELTDMAAAITKRDAQNKITTAGYAWGATVANVVHPFLTLLYSAGVRPFADDHRSTNLTSPEAIAVLDEQAELYRRGITDATLGVQDFAGGGVGMITMASWYEDTLRAAYGDAFEDTIGVGPIPAGDNWRSLQYAFFFGVDAKSANKDAAWAFLRWLNTSQAAGEPSCMGQMLFQLGALTGNKEDLQNGGDSVNDSFTKPFVDALDRSIPEPVVMQATEINKVLQTWILRAWTGELTAEAALKGADREITAILREFY